MKRHFWLEPDAEVTIDLFFERLHPEDRERVRGEIAAAIDSAEQLRHGIPHRLARQRRGEMDPSDGSHFL